MGVLVRPDDGDRRPFQLALQILDPRIKRSSRDALGPSLFRSSPC